MRTIHDHQVNPANDLLAIKVTDEPGSGGANHRYEITGFDATSNASNAQPDTVPATGMSKAVILFQNGPIAEAGVNGLTHEALLAIVADRLRSFQKGPFSTKANACALTHIEEAMHWLHARTLERMRRNVEGTHAA
jgi:hypothetical protein